MHAQYDITQGRNAVKFKPKTKSPLGIKSIISIIFSYNLIISHSANNDVLACFFFLTIIFKKKTNIFGFSYPSQDKEGKNEMEQKVYFSNI